MYTQIRLHVYAYWTRAFFQTMPNKHDKIEYAMNLQSPVTAINWFAIFARL